MTCWIRSSGMEVSNLWSNKISRCFWCTESLRTALLQSWRCDLLVSWTCPLVGFPTLPGCPLHICITLIVETFSLFSVKICHSYSILACFCIMELEWIRFAILKFSIHKDRPSLWNTNLAVERWVWCGQQGLKLQLLMDGLEIGPVPWGPPRTRSGLHHHSHE